MEPRRGGAVRTAVARRDCREPGSRAVEVGANRDADGSQGTIVERGPTRGYDSVPETRVVGPKLRQDLLRVGRRLYRSRRRNVIIKITN